MYVDSLLMDKRKRSPEEWSKILEEHLTQIGFFQHERYGYFCADDADFHDCLCHGMYAIAAGVVSFIPGFAGAVYLSLLYTGK